MDSARPLAGAAALRLADLGWQGDPRRLPPTSEPRLAIALLGGALAGSGPGTSPYVDGLSLVTGMVVPQHAACSNHADDGGCLDDIEPRGRSVVVSEAGARPLGRWDSNPAPACFAVQGQDGERSVTCDADSPTLTLVPAEDQRFPTPCGPSTDQAMNYPELGKHCWAARHGRWRSSVTPATDRC
jgi:hypothetical protein